MLKNPKQNRKNTCKLLLVAWLLALFCVSAELTEVQADANKNDIEVELHTPFAPLPSDEKNFKKEDCIRVKLDPEIYRCDTNGNIFKQNKETKKWLQVIISQGESVGGSLLMQYTSLIYKFLAGIVGLISVLMLIWGGIEISTAGVSQEGVTSGKDRIVAALAGLVMLFLSAVILNAINPTFFKI